MTRVAFTKPDGSPLPTWNQVITSTPPYVLESVTSAIMCQDGELRSGFGIAGRNSRLCADHPDRNLQHRSTGRMPAGA